jgi:hypothetical protein
MFEGFRKVGCALRSFTLAALVAAGSAVGAGAEVIDFETTPMLPLAPSTFVEAGATQTIDVPGLATVSGGVVLGFPTNFPAVDFATEPNVYGTASPGLEGDPSLLATTTIDLDPGAQATLVEGLVLNGMTVEETFTVEAFGPSGLLDTLVLADVPPNFSAGFQTFSFTGDPITRVTIEPGLATADWDYFVDSIAINESIPFCPDTPLSGCLEAGKGSLSVKEAKPGKEKLKLKMSSFNLETTQADFGTPGLVGARYDLCLYSGTGQLVTNLIVDRVGDLCGPKQKPCWKAKGTRGYSFKDKSAESSGVKKIKTKDGKGKLQLQAGNKAAKGQTSMPTGIVAELQGSSQVTAQVNVLGSSCFSATLPVRKASPTQIKAK